MKYYNICIRKSFLILYLLQIQFTINSQSVKYEPSLKALKLYIYPRIRYENHPESQADYSTSIRKNSKFGQTRYENENTPESSENQVGYPASSTFNRKNSKFGQLETQSNEYDFQNPYYYHNYDHDNYDFDRRHTVEYDYEVPVGSYDEPYVIYDPVFEQYDVKRHKNKEKPANLPAQTQSSSSSNFCGMEIGIPMIFKTFKIIGILLVIKSIVVVLPFVIVPVFKLLALIMHLKFGLKFKKLLKKPIIVISGNGTDSTSTENILIPFTVIDGFDDQSQVDFMVPIGSCFNLPDANIEEHRHFVDTHGRCFMVFLGADCTGEAFTFMAIDGRQDVPVPWFDTFLSMRSC